MRLAKWLKENPLTNLGPESILSGWKKLKKLPKGPQIFSRLLGMAVPYSGSIGAEIRELRPGFCKAVLRDRRAVRNHLRSIHAVAITNLGEMATGLAINSAIPKNHRGIVSKLETEYLKKSRGTLTVQAEIDLIPELKENTTYVVTASIYDASDSEVARVKATWIIGPSRKPQKTDNTKE